MIFQYPMAAKCAYIIITGFDIPYVVAVARLNALDNLLPVTRAVCLRRFDRIFRRIKYLSLGNG